MILPAQADITGQQAIAKVICFQSCSQCASMYRREVHVHRYMLSHDRENVVQLLQSGMCAQCGVLVMEKMNGDLLDLLMSGKLGGREERLRIFARICEAVKNCHDNYVAHLDLKPENILTNHDASVVKLADFGMSHFLPEDGHIPNEGSGTEMYSPPEILFRWDPFVDARAVDIWSLGILLHVMLSEEWPYLGRNLRQLPLHHFRHLQFSSSIDKTDKAFLRPILAFSPKDRPSIHKILSSDFLRPYLCRRPKMRISLLSPSNSSPLTRLLATTRMIARPLRSLFLATKCRLLPGETPQ